MTGRRIDYISLVQVGVPVDIGWGVAILNQDESVTRTCKVCGVSATSKRDPVTGRVAEVAIVHKKHCPVPVGNNPAWS